MPKNRYSSTFDALPSIFEGGRAISEREISTLVNAANAGRLSREQLVDGNYWHDRIGWNITAEQSKKGIDWMRAKACRQLTRDQCMVLGTFEKFHFMGLFRHATGYRDFYLRVYRVIGGHGSFDYICRPMAGKQTVEVIHEAY